MPTTPLYVGGGRRSAAPRITLAPTAGTAARDYDDELAKQLFASFEPSVPAPASPTPAPQLGTPVELDFGSTGSDATSSGNSGGGSVSPGTVGAIGAGLSALGVLGQDSTLANLGGMLGLAGTMAGSTSNSEALGTFGQAALSMAGVPGVGLAVNTANGNISGMINSVLGLVSPQAAAINALAGLTAGQTLGSTAAPAASLGLSALSDAAQIALGTAVNAVSTPNTPAQQEAISVVDMAATPNPNIGQSTGGTTAAMSGGFGEAATEGLGFGTTGTDTGDDGGGGGGGGSKIICTKLHALGLMPFAIYRADQEFGRQLAAAAPLTYAGYVLWARHIVSLMERKGWLGKLTVGLVYHVATPWSLAMAAEMGLPVAPTWFGRFLMRRGLQFCAAVGKYCAKQPAGMLA